MHRLGIVHRDIKVDNIVFGDKFFLKIIDFSFAGRSAHFNRCHHHLEFLFDIHEGKWSLCIAGRLWSFFSGIVRVALLLFLGKDYFKIWFAGNLDGHCGGYRASVVSL